MLQHCRVTTWYQSVTALAMIVSALAVAPPAAGGTPGDRPPASHAPEDCLSKFTVGVYLMEAGLVLKAVDHLEVAWRRCGHEVAVGRKLAEGYFLLKNFSRCEMIADDVLSKNDTDYETLLLKAKVRYLKRDPSAAVGLLETIRRAHGSHFEVERLLGNVCFENGDVERAIAAYEKCISLNSSYPYIYYRYGLLLERSNRHQEAEAALQEAIELDPGFSDAALQLAELYTSTGRSREAIPLLRGVLAADAGNNKALVKLAGIYLEIGRLDQGIKLLEARRMRVPLSMEAEIIRGRLYYEAKEYDEAFDVFRGLFEHEHNSPELARILGEICLKSGDLDRSQEYFETAIEIDPADYRSYLAKFFAASPDFVTDGTPILDLPAGEPATLLSRASALVKGHDFEGNYLLGVSFLSIDSLETAESHLLRAKEVNEHDEGTLLNLANVYEKLQQYEEAEKYLVILQARKPSDPTICNFYGYLLAEMGKDLDRAESLVREALRHDPENGYYLDSLGWVYYQMGYYARAIVELEKASQRVTNDPVIFEHLGDAYRAMRRFDEARAAYKRSSLYQDDNTGILEKIESTNQYSE
jgi:tetratricopeptide (TPR) repeat protein